ncbi:Hypothetical predicted protein [Marmota monax]|uniref:Uncharacterized protein n=1 Tax=Marmota monax TaxID=9995 RepID=A0A5E4AP41_MARMO|nr:hypothetical protein GHT09_014338 [Marmota monax]VTJ58700.1 Hypothetical predicted protein [Marmota monax]
MSGALDMGLTGTAMDRTSPCSLCTITIQESRARQKWGVRTDKHVLEGAEQLELRVSALEEDMDDVESSEEKEDDEKLERGPSSATSAEAKRLGQAGRSPTLLCRRCRSLSPRRRSPSPHRERHPSEQQSKTSPEQVPRSMTQIWLQVPRSSPKSQT